MAKKRKEQLITRHIYNNIIDSETKGDHVSSLYVNSKTQFKEIYISMKSDESFLILDTGIKGGVLRKMIFIPTSLLNGTVVNKKGVFIDNDIVKDIDITTSLFKYLIDSVKVLEIEYSDEYEEIVFSKMNSSMIVLLENTLKFKIKKHINAVKSQNSDLNVDKKAVSVVNDFLADMSAIEIPRNSVDVNKRVKDMVFKDIIKWINIQYGSRFEVESIKDEKNPRFFNSVAGGGSKAYGYDSVAGSGSRIYGIKKQMNIYVSIPRCLKGLMFYKYNIGIDLFYDNNDDTDVCFNAFNINGVLGDYSAELLNGELPRDIVGDATSSISNLKYILERIKYDDFLSNNKDKVDSILFFCAINNMLSLVCCDELILSNSNKSIAKENIVEPLFVGKNVLMDLNNKCPEKIINRVVYF